MPIVLITPEAMREKRFPFVDNLQEAGFEVRYPHNPHLARGLGDDEETIRELNGIHASIASGENYSRKVLTALPEFRVIARCGVGYDRVDVAAATDHGIPVTITPTANHEAVAELAMALLFATAKSIVAHDKAIRDGQWPRATLTPIRKTTLGIFGLGRIGRSMAIRGKALSMNVMVTEKYPNEDFVRDQGIELVEFDELLARSDYLSIHCPLNDETRGMFNREVFAKMKPGSVLINTARGGLVNESDLLAALQSGQLRAAGLDVFEQEPPSTDNPLFQLDNVVCSPHLAGLDEESMVAMGIEAADCIIKLHRGEWPNGAVVNEALKDGWKWE